ncbi:unnamed protein product [Trifolium pratense]|uniref:Uncharacterized protein n=1 Tax=Trifolium pratense TaxID=57577 RepID=A0ACB0JLA6_TRIPR|nr:unnamed protein product [Trifolium pratense]
MLVQLDDINGSMQSATHVQQLIFALFSSLPKTKLANFGMLLWSIWKQRNNEVSDNISAQVQQVIERAKAGKGGLSGKWRSTQTKIGFGLQKICIAIIGLRPQQV